LYTQVLQGGRAKIIAHLRRFVNRGKPLENSLKNC
jgi:hypothetical protein